MSRRFVSLCLAALAAAVPCGAARAVPLDQLVEEKATETWGYQMPEAGTFDIAVQSAPPSSEPLMISDWWLDQQTGQFVANVVTREGATERVWGLATLTVPVPVPTRRIMPGETITGADLEEVALPAASLGTFAVTRAEKLDGMEVRRVLVPGRPVMIQSVGEPIAVPRGERVTLSYRHGGLNLTAPGRALGDGLEGQEVRVVNLQSNKTVIGIARADGTVEVTP
ncbi:flagellar basal body P-ring formation chaperone FlgA [Frigidibacter sp. MR17.24]|uniref:flagellar basal body P-ring formation chaperone FlgA n=1 Tax=Frigidibacter sp. MR17.24 TaxID=3127345 RepID=UPI0030130488